MPMLQLTTMNGNNHGNGQHAVSYQGPPPHPLSITWRGIRRGWWIALLTTAVTVAAALSWTSNHPREYRASAEILVNPIAVDDQTFLGVQTLRAAGDASRTIQTAVGLLRTNDAARSTADALGPGWTAQGVLDRVVVQGQGQSNLVQVTARARDPKLAARLATEFARRSLALRRATIRSQLDDAIARLRAQIRNLRGQRARDEFAAELRRRLDTLDVAREVGDPTLSLAQVAAVPPGPSGTPTSIVVAAAALAGIVLGLMAALLRDVLDRRVRDENELWSLYQLPVLARIPRARRRSGAVPGTPPYRGLVGELIDAGDDARSLLVTSAAEGDGKATAAVGLALALAEAGRSVILVDLDPRDRGVAHVLGVASPGAELVPVPQSDRVRIVAPEAAGLLELQERLPAVVAQLHDSVDHVVIDCPALGAHGEALWITQHVQKVLVIARPRHTTRASYVELRERLERTGNRPAGVLVVGGRPARMSAYRQGPTEPALR
jgi:Mrp family chromosome partitioning ATPase